MDVKLATGQFLPLEGVLTPAPLYAVIAMTYLVWPVYSVASIP